MATDLDFDPNAPITSTSLDGAKPFALTQPKPTSEMDGLLGSYESSATSFLKGLEAKAKSRETASESSFDQYLKTVLETPGEEQLRDAEYRTSVDPLEDEVAEISNDIMAEQNALRRQVQALEKNPQGLYGGGLEQTIQTVKDRSLARQTDLMIQQDIKQGRLDRARDRVDRYVSAKLEQSRTLTEALKLNHENNKDLFTTAETRAFDTKVSQLEKQAEQKAYSEKTYYETLIGETGENPNADPITAASQAILANESSGSYTSLSPILPSGSAKGQRSYGKYQVLESNIPSWTEAFYGERLTPQQFLSNPAAQEAVQQGKMRELWDQYGNIEDVASVYFTGVPYAQAVSEGRRDQATGMTVQQYVAKASQKFSELSGGTGIDPASTEYGTDPYYTSLFANSKGGKALTGQQTTPLTKATIVLGQLGELQAQISDTPTDPILGILRDNNPYDVKARQISAQLKATVPNLARGVYGEVGVLTEADIQNYIQTLPNIQSPEQANNLILAMTLETVRNSFRTYLETYANSGRDVSGFARQYEALSAQVNSLKSELGVASTPEGEAAAFDEVTTGGAQGPTGNLIKGWFDRVVDAFLK